VGPEILMAAGALVWAAGELLAVVRRRNETTSDYVAKGRHYWWARVLIGIALAWLTLHLGFGFPATIFGAW